jgi:non-heme chloroperoxidase
LSTFTVYWERVKKSVGGSVKKREESSKKGGNLIYKQFRYGFANAVDENEAHELYNQFAVPGSGTFVFQGAAANLNPWTEDRVNTKNPARGPLLLIAGQEDHTVPLAVVTAEYKLQQHNPAVTEFREIPGRGHSLVIDHGWREVAEIALAFIAQQLSIGQ